ncbi:hypothetical protein WJX77_008589 [Trebouxia sp. C0004]
MRKNLCFLNEAAHISSNTKALSAKDVDELIRKSSKESRLASQVQQTKAGGGGGDSSQLSIDSYCDSREVTAEHAKWLADSKLAQHMTLALDGWSNARMESIYSFNIIFPDRRVILLKANELSSLTHSAENIAELVVNITEEYGPRDYWCRSTHISLKSGV